MENITTTHLRTKTAQLVKTLRDGNAVSLIHRSKVIGQIKPVGRKPVVIKDLAGLEKILDGLKPSRLVPRSQREKIYRKRLINKYGKNLPGR